jgi:hypothetical protein
VANCDHARACLLALDFQATPVGAVDCSKFRKAVTEETGGLIEKDYADNLLKIIDQCSEHSAPVVVPYTPLKGAQSGLYSLILC